ncbi:MAG TPA: hypothetical protein VFB49_02535 [Patescibacteria group bacterium]|nr:hypothetical protein [Patescibacteria group bacterium]
MKRPRVAFLIPAGLLLTALAAAVPARADQIVYFVNGKAMTVKSVERGDRVTILEIEGGGRIGVPSVQIDRVEELQLSAPAAATAAVVVPPPAPAAPVQPVANLQANAAAGGNPAGPVATAAVATPQTAPVPDGKSSPPAQASGKVNPVGLGELDAVPPQALPPSYNPGGMGPRGGQYGAQGGAIGVGARFNNNLNGVIGRPDGPGRRLNARLGPLARVRPPVSAPPPALPGQAQPPSNQGPAAPGSAPAGAPAATQAPAAPQPPPANPDPPADASQSDQGADNGASAPPAPEEPAPNDPPADENPPDGEN